MEKELEFIFDESIDGVDLSQPSPPEIISEEEEEEEDFEFAFSIESDPLSLPDSTADQIFHNGQILPLYPLFNRDLITKSMDELIIEYKTRENRSGSNSSSSSIASDPDRLSTSAPDRWRKSSSTGSSAPRKWKLRDLVGRSRSDSKERFVVVGFPDEREKEKKEKKGLKSFNSLVKEKKGKGESAKEMDIVTAHRIYYGKSGAGGGQAAAAGGYRRSFLPYRQELLGGIFGNAKHHHPFGN